MTPSPLQQDPKETPATDGAGISFVVTVYNKRPFLPQMIAGLAGQQGDFAREYIFIDDGSTDGSPEELARLTEGWTNVRIVRQENRGPSVATNRGLEETRFPYIKLVDADDVLLPWASLHLLQALRRHNGAVLAHGDTEPYGSAESALGRLSGVDTEPRRGNATLDRQPLVSVLSGHFDIGPTNSLIDTAAARRAGGCDPRVFVQDFSLMLRLATVGTFVALDETVALSAATADGRVNDDGPQVLHDINLTLAHFLAENRLPSALMVRAVRRAAGRAWRWARRREGVGPLSRWALLNIRARLPFPPVALVEKSCGAFTLSRNVRRVDG